MTQQSVETKLIFRGIKPNNPVEGSLFFAEKQCFIFSENEWIDISPTPDKYTSVFDDTIDKIIREFT